MDVPPNGGHLPDELEPTRRYLNGYRHLHDTTWVRVDSEGLDQRVRRGHVAYQAALTKRPKTAAGVSTVALPLWLVPELERHFADYAELLPDGRVFVGLYGATPARPNFSPVWARALKKAGLSGIHVHDLRHTGHHFAAISGASTRELMGRMGHVSVNAALVYQHRTAVRDRAIADSLDAMVEALNQADVHGSGHV